MSNQRCEDCIYWENLENIEGTGNCRESPPVIVESLLSDDDNADVQIDIATRFPITFHADWCGKWKSANNTMTEEGE